MPLSLRHWRAPHLLGAWAAYWVLLAVVVLGRPLLAFRELTATPGRKGSASVSYGTAGFDAKLVADGVTVWHGEASFAVLSLWIVGPPLLLWIVWLLSRPRRLAAAPDLVGGGAAAPALHAAESDPGAAARAAARANARAAAERADRVR